MSLSKQSLEFIWDALHGLNFPTDSAASKTALLEVADALHTLNLLPSEVGSPLEPAKSFVVRKVYLVCSDTSATVHLKATPPTVGPHEVAICTTLRIPKKLFNPTQLAVTIHIPSPADESTTLVDLTHAVQMAYGEKVKLTVDYVDAGAVAQPQNSQPPAN